MKLSILICSISKRSILLERLLLQLQKQTAFTPVEILIDKNETASIGAKRNNLINASTGDYIVFIDDDDTVTDDYISSILAAQINNPDVIVFDVLRFVNNVIDKPAIYGIEFNRDYNTSNYYYRLPNHLMPVKRELALQVMFKEINFGEDADYAARLHPIINTQTRINKILYHYLFNPVK